MNPLAPSLALVLLAGAFAAAASGATTPPMPPATSFSAHVDNTWFPLVPGTQYVYRGVKDGKASRDVVTVSHRTKMIIGVPCIAVEDRLYLRGSLEERTTDWYSQDARGNVWYFGENTAELDSQGHVTTIEGTWLAGRDGARPGVYMPAHPRVGAVGLQEYYKGHAEDRFTVLRLFGTVLGRLRTNALLTQETTRLEAGTIDHKLYVRGIGTVLEQTEKGGDERNELVSVTKR